MHQTLLTDYWARCSMCTKEFFQSWTLGVQTILQDTKSRGKDLTLTILEETEESSLDSMVVEGRS